MIDVQPLKDVIESYKTKDKLEDLRKILRNFKCDKDEDIEVFLSKFAIDYEDADVSRTFLVIDLDFPAQILGYFAIGLNSMKFDEGLIVPDAYEGIHLYENGYRPIYKLFMLGKNDIVKTNDKLPKIKMADIFNTYILDYFDSCKKYVGGRMMYIDCDKTPKLKKYYESLGFTYYDTLAENNLIRMIRRI